MPIVERCVAASGQPVTRWKRVSGDGPGFGGNVPPGLCRCLRMAHSLRIVGRKNTLLGKYTTNLPPVHYAARVDTRAGSRRREASAPRTGGVQMNPGPSDRRGIARAARCTVKCRSASWVPRPGASWRVRAAPRASRRRREAAPKARERVRRIAPLRQRRIRFRGSRKRRAAD